ncbi:MAG: carboxypeptidase-like regulatory domain-containing protein [Lutibacter sp.]
MKSLYLCSLFIFLSCSSNKIDDIPCTMEARAGLNITVKNAVTNQLLSSGITVNAKDGNYTETLEFFNANIPIFSGAWEREGTYIVTVSGVGYTTFVSDPITVTADECHVIPQQLQVVLQPE